MHNLKGNRIPRKGSIKKAPRRTLLIGQLINWVDQWPANAMPYSGGDNLISTHSCVNSQSRIATKQMIVISSLYYQKYCSQTRPQIHTETTNDSRSWHNFVRNWFMYKSSIAILAGEAPKDTLKRHHKNVRMLHFCQNYICVHSFLTGTTSVLRGHYQLVHHCPYYLFVTNKKTSPPFLYYLPYLCRPWVSWNSLSIQMFCRNYYCA